MTTKPTNYWLPILLVCSAITVLPLLAYGCFWGIQRLGNWAIDSFIERRRT